VNEELEEMILLEVRNLRRKGRHKEALGKLISLYDDIMNHAPSEPERDGHSVLSEWIDFAEEYSPARDKLDELRSIKTSLILEGVYDKNFFSELETINRAFKDVQATVDLFQKIEAMSPEAAGKLSGIVVGSLVDLKEYHWARKYMLSPQAEYCRLKQKFKEWGLFLEEEKSSSKLSQDDVSDYVEVFEEVFVEGVLRLIAVLKHTNEVDAALEIQKDAVSLIGHKALITDACRGF
jgi:hypothetical protein